LLTAGLVVASLLTFPSSIALMIAVWLLWSAIRIHSGKAAWPCLTACVAIILVKRVTLVPGLVVLAAAMVVVAGLDLLWVRRAVRGKRAWRWASTVALLGMWVTMLADWQTTAHRSNRSRLEENRPVACIGDSLTSGIPPYGGYPDELQKLIAIPVMNLGREGITSAEALKALPALLKANPQVVVIELGGHDFLKACPRSSTKTNLEALIRACRNIGAEVILVEIPRGFVTDPFAGLEREIARSHDVEILSDGAIRKLVLWSPSAPPGIWFGRHWHLSDDGLHPNSKGNQHLARCVAKSLERLFGRRIRAMGVPAADSLTG
jgi:lysophospholipase L1-like esterase